MAVMANPYLVRRLRAGSVAHFLGGNSRRRGLMGSEPHVAEKGASRQKKSPGGACMPAGASPGRKSGNYFLSVCGVMAVPILAKLSVQVVIIFIHGVGSIILAMALM